MSNEVVLYVWESWKDHYKIGFSEPKPDDDGFFNGTGECQAICESAITKLLGLEKTGLDFVPVNDVVRITMKITAVDSGVPQGMLYKPDPEYAKRVQKTPSKKAVVKKPR